MFRITEYTPTADHDIAVRTYLSGKVDKAKKTMSGTRRTLEREYNPGKRMSAQKALEAYLGEPVQKVPFDAFGRHFCVTKVRGPNDRNLWRKGAVQQFVYIRQADLEDHGTQAEMEAELRPLMDKFHDHLYYNSTGMEVLSTAGWVNKLTKPTKSKWVSEMWEKNLNYYAFFEWGVDLYRWAGLDMQALVRNYKPFRYFVDKADAERAERREELAERKSHAEKQRKLDDEKLYAERERARKRRERNSSLRLAA